MEYLAKKNKQFKLKNGILINGSIDKLTCKNYFIKFGFKSFITGSFAPLINNFDRKILKY